MSKPIGISFQVKILASLDLSIAGLWEADVKKQKLGNSDLDVSVIGLGCMTMAGVYGKADDAESEESIRHALDNGMNFIDTSDAYGNGKNEDMLGRTLKGYRDKAIICTKFGNLGRGGGGSRTVDGRPEYVFEACDKSLQRLGIDVIDLYLVHRIDPSVPIEDTVGAMKQLIEQGKVRYIGLSEAGEETIRRAHAVHPLSALQSEYSLMYRDAETEWLPTCKDLGITFMGYSPLGRSLLTGAIHSMDDLPEEDRRRSHPRFFEDNLPKNVEKVLVLEEVSKNNQCSPSQAALAWVLAQDYDIIPIPGAKQKKHIDDNIAAADVNLKAEDVKKLNDVFAPGSAAGTRYPEKQLGTLNI